MERPIIFTTLQKYKYLILLISVGIFLMLIPEKKEPVQQTAETKAEQTEITFEQELSEILSLMEGAGKVQVLLAKNSGEETVFQTDENSSEESDRRDIRMDTVIVTSANRDQTGLVKRVDPPIYQGAVVLCQGADSPVIRLAIVDAVSDATGLDTGKITVLKMK